MRYRFLALLCLLCTSCLTNLEANEKSNGGSVYQPGQCFADDEPEMDVKPVSASFFMRDPDLYVTIQKAKHLIKNPHTLFVDVRSERDYEQIRIPGSIRLPIEQLKYKGYLREKNIVIIGDGISYRLYETQIDDLIDSNFTKIHILEGGIHAWFDKGGEVEGNTSELAHLPVISVASLLDERVLGPWLVVDYGKKKSFQESVNGKVVHIPSGPAFSMLLNNRISEQKSPMLRVVLVSDENVLPKEVSAWLQNSDIEDRYLLKQTTEYIPVYKTQFKQRWSTSSDAKLRKSIRLCAKQETTKSE